jgi:hypothetical protein
MSDSEAKTETLAAAIGLDAKIEPTPAPSPSTETPAPSHQFPTCNECGAPLDQAQRYCVNCGAHRRDANDPAARYLGEASARARRATAAPVAAAGAGLWRPSDWLAAIAIALVPIAAAVGVAIGRSSNSQDSAVIRALDKQRSSLVPYGGSTTNSASGTSNSKKSSKKTSSKNSKSASDSSGGKSSVTGFKLTKSAQQQGAADAAKDQSRTGKSYVQGENSLPNTVIP